MIARTTPSRCFPLLALTVVLVAGCGASDPSVRSLTILHTSDLHARLLPDAQGRGGFAHLATAIRRECARAEACLVLDGGDLVQGSPVSTLYKGLPIYEVANGLGFDAATLGNHEFDYGWEMIPRFLETAEFPVVAANVVDGEGRLLADAPYVLLEAGGIRVGVIGVLTDRLRFMATSADLGPWKVLPAVETVRRHVPRVAEQADLVVVLGHLVEEEEDALLESIQEIPVVITGHPHDRPDQPKVVDERVGVRVRPYGRELGRLDLRIDVDSNELLDWTWKSIPIDTGRFEPDPDVAQHVALWESRVADRVAETIGRSTRFFSQEDVRVLVERAMREASQADLAYVNPGGVRDSLPRGRIRARHIWSVMPFDNHLVVGEFTGRELPRRFAKEQGLDPDRTYRLATMDFVVATWKDRGAADLTFEDTGRLVRDVIIDWIREQGVIE